MMSDCTPLESLDAFVLSPDHAVIVDHFPGKPLVPGTLLLEAILDRAKKHHPDQFIKGVAALKFKAQLLPGSEAFISFKKKPEGLRLVVRTAQGIVAEGLLLLETESPGSP